MANSGIGQDSYVRYQLESTYGTPVTSSMTLLPVKPGSGFVPRVLRIENDNLIASRLAQAPNQGRIMVDGSYDMDLHPSLVGGILNWFLGAATTAGPTDSTYTHYWTIPTSGERIDKFATIQQAAGGDTADQYTSVTLTSLVFTSDNEGNWMMTMNGVGQTYSDGVARISSFSYPSTAPFGFFHTVFNEATIGNVTTLRNCTITIDLGYDPERFFLGDQKILQPVFNTIPSVTVEAEIDADKQWLSIARAHTSQDLTITLTHTANAGGSTPFSLVFEFPGCRLEPETSIPLDNDRLFSTLSWSSSYGGNTTNGTSVQGEIRLVDATATYT